MREVFKNYSAALLAVGATLAIEAAKAPPVPAESTVSPDMIAMKHIKKKIVHHQLVRIDGNHDLQWSPPGSTKICYTDVPLEADVNGQTRYFELSPFNPHGLRSIEVYEIPEDVKLVPGINTLTGHGIEHVANKRGRIILNITKMPFVPISFEQPDGHLSVATKVNAGYSHYLPNPISLCYPNTLPHYK